MVRKSDLFACSLKYLEKLILIDVIICSDLRKSTKKLSKTQLYSLVLDDVFPFNSTFDWGKGGQCWATQTEVTVLKFVTGLICFLFIKFGNNKAHISNGKKGIEKAAVGVNIFSVI